MRLLTVSESKRVVVAALVMMTLAWLGNGQAAGQSATFTGVGGLNTSFIDSDLLNISADGNVAVGQSFNDDFAREAFRWTSGGGREPLGFLPGGGGAFNNNSFAYDASADGSVIVGFSDSAAAAVINHAFSYSGGPMNDLGTLAGDLESKAFGVSDDGSIIVGYSDPTSGTANDEQAVMWSGGSITPLGFLPGGTYSRAKDISADGATIVGTGGSTAGRQAFRYDGGSPAGLGDLGGGGFMSEATAVNADGSMIVGFSESGNGQEAFLWRSSTGVMSPLGDLGSDDGFGSRANAISADGSVIVGTGTVATGNKAFMYFAESETMVDLQDTLINDFNATGLTGWTLNRAQGVSADGLTLVGVGTNPDDETEAWIATLIPVKEYTKGANGLWDVNGNWSASAFPFDKSDTVIKPADGLEVTGPSVNTMTRSLLIGRDGGSGNVTLDLQPGVTVSAANGVTLESASRITGGGTLQGEITGQAGSAVEITQPTMTLGLSSSTAGVDFALGTGIALNGNTLHLRDADWAEFAGLITMGDGSVLSSDNGVLLEAIVGAIEVDAAADVSINGPFRNNGAVTGPTSGSLTISGPLSGNGEFTGIVTAEHNLAPGESIGHMRFDSLTLGEQSVFEVEVAGNRRAGDDQFGDETNLQLGGHDWIEVLDALTLDGDLQIVLSGYTPQAGDVFDLFDADTVAGEFNQILRPGLDEGLVWDMSTLEQDGELRVALIPEPTTMTILAIGGWLVISGRRRRDG